MDTEPYIILATTKMILQFYKKRVYIETSKSFYQVLNITF